MKKTAKLFSIILAIALIAACSVSAFACCGVYVGNQASENGSIYMGRSEDIGDLYGKIFGVAPSKTIADGEIYKDTYGFSMDYSKFNYPKTTYSYTYVKDSTLYGETMTDENGNFIGEAYAEAGQNEKGVAMTATVSTSYNSNAKAADKLVSTGIYEVSMTSIILGGASTAKEAVDLLAAIIDEYGAGECNSIMFSDPKETWYFEIVSGHQYAAVKMPADKASVQPNIMLLGAIDINDTENVVVSENLVKLAEDNGFLVTDENGNIDVAKTYARESNGNGQNSRYWQGLFYLNPEEAEKLDYTTINMKTNPVSLYIDPTEKLSTMDVLKLLAYRGEGSQYNSNENGSITAIGNNRQSECHIFETRLNMPTELSIIQWQAMADAEFSIYVPYYSALVTETSELYSSNEIPKQHINDDTNGQINMIFHIINSLCYNNRTNCALAVKDYFEKYQESLIEQQAKVDEDMLLIYAHGTDAAKEAATAIGKDLAQQVSTMGDAVLTALREYLAGDMAAPFALSEEITSVMPDYSVSEELILNAHSLTFNEEAEKTCTENGVKAHYSCDYCDAIFFDEEMTAKATEDELVISASHSLIKTEAKEAKVNVNGNIEYYSCEDCEKIFADEKAEKEIKLSDTVIEKLPEIAIDNKNAQVSPEAVDNAISKAENSNNIVIDVKEASVTSVTLNAESIKKVADKDEKATLTLSMPCADIEIDKKALDVISANGEEIKFVINKLDKKDLNEKQQKALEDKNSKVVISASIFNGADYISDFKGGKITVSVPFEIPQNMKATDFNVYYVADDGKITEIKSTYKDGKMIFETEHFSEYVIASDKLDPNIPATGDNSCLVLFALLFTLSAIGLIFLPKKKYCK